MPSKTKRGPKPTGARWSKDRYCTPQNVCDALYRFFGQKPDLDPCWDPDAVMRALTTFALSRGQDGLSESWRAFCKLWINPPYSGPGPWIAKMFERLACGEPCEIVTLLPLTPGVQWFGNLSASPFLHALGSPSPKRIQFLKMGTPDKSPRGETVFAYLTTRQTEPDFDLEHRIGEFAECFGDICGLIAKPIRYKRSPKTAPRKSQKTSRKAA